MSLRTRLLVGLVAVALVLGGVTTWVFRTTRGNLLAQVDEQLERAVPRLRDSGRLGIPVQPRSRASRQVSSEIML